MISGTTARKYAESARLSAEIVEVIPGGVDSPFRSFHEVGGHTIFFDHAQGSRLFDVDGNEYIDYLGAWGPAVLGHCHPKVVAAAQAAVGAGAVFGAPHRYELELARALIRLLPSMQKVRFVNSGTEAVMSAVRLARGFTGRNLILMFEGGYHGHSDSVLASRSHSSSTGIPNESAQNTIQIPYNDVEALRTTFREHGKQIAGVLIEPICGSMGVVAPEPGFLQAVRQACDEVDALLIFDEVITGLRVARGGAQRLYDVKPDLTCLGKALGGGMPIGAYGGRSDVMSYLLPEGKVYQAGTFSGNPATMAAAIATIDVLDHDDPYELMEARAQQLFEGVAESAKRRNLQIQLQRIGSMFAILFAPHAVRNFQDHLKIDAKVFAKFFHEILDRGIYFPPSAVDAACLSAAHTQQDTEETVKAVDEAFATIS